MESKVVFFDIDGTIWDWKGVIPQSTKDAIAKLKANGHIPIICTGRATGHVTSEELLSMGFAGMIAACGAYVEYDGEILFNNLLDDDELEKVVNLSIEYNVPIVVEGEVKHWVTPNGFENDEFVDRIYKDMGENAVPLQGFFEGMKASKFAGDVIRISDFEKFKAGIPDTIHFIEHSLVQGVKESAGADNEILGTFEGVRKGISKAHGIEMICNHLGIEPKDTYAVGDSNNDYEMIQFVGTGIAMGDGAEVLKKAADYVTTPLWEDGIQNALSHFGLI